MKKRLVIMSILMCLGAYSSAVPKLDLGLNMGTMLPNHDTLAQQTFASDFYWQAMFGMVDDSGWEIRGNLGSYWDISHFNLSDIAANRRINLRPLTASLIYNVQGGLIQPYFGAGAGGYFYDVMDDIFGNLESGFKLGFHILGGIKLKVNDRFYLNAEYTQHYLPAVFFTNEKNFDVISLTIGGGFEFSQNSSSRQATTQYRYTKDQEDILMQIQQNEKEIRDLQAKRDNLEDRIDNFYENNTAPEDSREFAVELRKVKYWEGKIRDIDQRIQTAQSDLRDLKQQWARSQVDNQPVENHVVYLEQNYVNSPYGLQYDNGYFRRRAIPYRYRYNTINIVPPPVNNAPPTVEERQEFVKKKQQALEDLKSRKAK